MTDSPDPRETAGSAVETVVDAEDRAAIDAAAEAEKPGWRRRTALFLTGQTVSLFGSMLVQYAVMWYLTLTTKDGTVMALSTVFGFLPQAIVSIFGGVWADRHNRKLLIMGADASIAVATLTLAILMMQGTNDLWLIYAALAVRSTGAGIQTPAVGALLPQIVPTNKLLRINGINQTIQAGMMLLAPAVAAALYANFAIEMIFFVDVVTAVAGIGLLALIPVATIRQAGVAVTGYFEDLREGVRYIAGHAFVRWLMGLYAFVMVLAAAPSFLTPLMVARSFGEEPWKLMTLELAFSVGMMAAGATVAVWGEKFDRITLIMASAVAFGVLSIGLGLSPNLWVFFFFMFLVGVTVPAFSTPSMTALQETVEPERQGRVFGFLGIVSAVAMPLGMVVFGPLANVWTVQTVLVISGVATFVVAILALALPGGKRAIAAARAHGAGSQKVGIPADTASGTADGP
ncbi:MFS transporter [Serinibacter arcticus]|uniref:MFS transporter n=1 Tax=Serinibacter arcticus TaxID=1655435 RepID=A0A2U1ZUU5_9MICO|nr:MFS transporter [Serinibacter arcticus]PWD50720.1 MFS transporter [Serinibacter arcticus]